jgi:ubiquinone/menaquinone biosynthesis C-methylase UbiE
MPEPEESLTREIQSYYELAQEDDRLVVGRGMLEFARMQELLARSLTPPSGVILDVGGASGRYSIWLAQKGYEVHLIDPVGKHIDQARAASEAEPTQSIASVRLGDARHLEQDDEACDAALLMGPMYHLTERTDREKALSEAYRVLRNGGVLFSVAINRFAALFDGLTRGLSDIDNPYFTQILERTLAEGQHRNPRGETGYFTTAFFHRPEELEEEVRQARFSVDELVVVQGPGGLASDLEGRLTDPLRKEQLLNLIRRVEHERTLLGVSPHFAVIGKKRPV